MKKMTYLMMCITLITVLARPIFAESPLPIKLVYPRVEISPRNPVAGDSVILHLIKGLHSNSCTPKYTNVSAKLLGLATGIPRYKVTLSYTETWPDPTLVFCLMVMTEYGPSITLPDMEYAEYIVFDDTVQVGSFFVVKDSTQITPPQKVFSINGSVYDDPYPMKRMSMPLEGVKVFIQNQIYYLDYTAGSGEAIQPIAPVFIYDSTTTDSKGAFTFSKLEASSYTLSFSRKGYTSKSLNMYLQSDTVVGVALLAENSAGTVSGNITEDQFCPDGMGCIEIAPMPIAGCSVAVFLYNQYPLPPVRELYAPIIVPFNRYTAVTDSLGNYSIKDIPISQNQQPITVTARKKGYISGNKQSTVSNMTTTTVDFQLEKEYQNIDTATVDNVVFSVTTQKMQYGQYETLNAQYTIKNNSMATVTYSIPCGIAVSIVVTDENDSTLLESPKGAYCMPNPAVITLAPGEDTVIALPSYYITAKPKTLKVKAQLIGYDKTQTSVSVLVEPSVGVSPGTVTKLRNSLSDVNFISARNELMLNIPTAGELRIRAFNLNGREIPGVSMKKFVTAGYHVVPLRQKVSGVFILNIQGNGFDYAKKISVMGK